MRLLVLCLLVVVYTQAVCLSDMAHGVPNCSIGNLTLHNNLLGDTLSFIVDLSGARALFVHFVIVSETNNQVIASGDGRQDVALMGGYCHTPLRIVLLVRLSLNESTEVLAQPMSALLIHCNESALYTQMGFDCVKSPLINALPYTMTNCLLCNDDDLHAPPKNTSLAGGAQEHSPLYWYLRCLDEGPLVNNDTLCGESMCVHLYRSGLYLDQCDANNVRVMPPWYRMVVYLVARSFNYGSAEAYRDVWWLVGVELLERHCEFKDHGLSEEELEAPESFFNSFLDHFKTEEDARGPLCQEIGRRFDDRYNETMSRMLFNQWYYKGFKFVLPPSSDMRLKAIYLLSFVCVMPFILIVIILYAIYRLKQWRSKYSRPRVG